MDPVEQIKEALKSGELTLEQVSARKLGEMLGKTTSVLYHRWGSVDGFLHAVGQAAMPELRDRLAGALRDRGLEAVAVAFVDFGLSFPSLYHLMFERRYDWAALRAAGLCPPEVPGLRLWASTLSHLACAGSTVPGLDALTLFSGLHGLVSLAASGRANVGATGVSDAEMARAGARNLARLLATGLTQSLARSETASDPSQEMNS